MATSSGSELIVFRVEHAVLKDDAKGWFLGPYAGASHDSALTACSNALMGAHQFPETHPQWGDVCWETADGDDGEPDFEWSLAGFASQRDVLAWFAPPLRDVLTAHGFVVRAHRVPEQHILTSWPDLGEPDANDQVAFDSRHATPTGAVSDLNTLSMSDA